jgi:glycerophosphoryl diester phosphodiesterase
MGKKVNAWTDDDPAHAAILIRMGVSGIITNNPGKYR